MKLKVKEGQHKAVYRAMDKLDKLEVSEVAKLLLEIGLMENQVKELVKIINLKTSNAEKLEFMEKFGEDQKVVRRVRRAPKGPWNVWPIRDCNVGFFAGARRHD